ncbi:MAG: tetratricopeptide repeat protein [Cyanobacteria bacterium J06650_10]
MAFKKDSWLVRGVLIVAVAAFISVPIVLGLINRPQQNAGSAANSAPTADLTTQLQGEINGYTAVLGREPNNQTALRGLIDAKAALGDLEGTVEPLEKLAELNPTVPEYSIVLAQTKQQLQDLEGAAQIYRRVLTQTPGNVQALEGLVQLLVSQERTEAAAGLLRDTLATADASNEINPGSVDKLSVKLLLGQVFVAQQNYDEAITLYDETIAEAEAASPNQPDFRPTLAKALVLREKGDEAAAEPLFDAALALAPTQYKDGVRQLISEGTTPADDTAETEATDTEATEDSTEETPAVEEEATEAPDAP